MTDSRPDKTLTLIAAIGRNGALGHEGAMPWHLPRELQHFKSVTMGKALLMGRRTHESIGRALPGRQNIVITRNAGYVAEGCDVAQSLREAIEIAASTELMIIGGGELYRQTIDQADRMILTTVDCEPEADTWFPQWDPQEWTVVSRRQELPDEKNPLAYEVAEYRRKPGVRVKCQSRIDSGT